MKIGSTEMNQQHSFMIAAAAILDAIYEQEFEDAQRWFEQLRQYWLSHTIGDAEFHAREALLTGIENMLQICE